MGEERVGELIRRLQAEPAAEMIDATLVIESRRFRCRAAISTKASSQSETDFVALQWQGEWLITERQHAREGRTYPVDVIELRSTQPNVYAARNDRESGEVDIDALYDGASACTIQVR